MKTLPLATRVLEGIELFVYFAYQVAIANLQVAALVLKPNRKMKPAFVEIPLSVKSDWGLYALSSMITLTPGTLSLELSTNKKTLLVHVIHTSSPEGTVADIVNGFERRVLRVIEGGTA